MGLFFQDRWDPNNLLLRLDLTSGSEAQALWDQLPLNGPSGDQYEFNLQKIPEGPYEVQLRILNLLNFADQLKGCERSCAIQVDRTLPKAKIVLRSGAELPLDKILRVGPGETFEVRTDNASPTRVYSCWLDKATSGPCKDFIETGNRLSSSKTL